MKTLHLTLKKKWFDMILSGEKTEEYRELKDYWKIRLINQYPHYDIKEFDLIKFTNGYAKNAPTMLVECNGIEIGKAKPEWSDNWHGDVFVIKLGNIIESKNLFPPNWITRNSYYDMRTK